MTNRKKRLLKRVGPDKGAYWEILSTWERELKDD
jgi:hypothetical protein